MSDEKRIETAPAENRGQKTGSDAEKPGFTQSENDSGHQSFINPESFHCCKKVKLATEVWPR